MHGDAFGGARFVDDALEETANRSVGQRTLVVAGGVGENFIFARGLVDGHAQFLLELADLERTLRAFIEQFDELSVDFVHAATPVADVHEAPLEVKEVKEVKKWKPANLFARHSPLACPERSRGGSRQFFIAPPRGGRGLGGQLV